jgi:hypothetical protein
MTAARLDDLRGDRCNDVCWLLRLLRLRAHRNFLGLWARPNQAIADAAGLGLVSHGEPRDDGRVFVWLRGREEELPL